MSTQRECQVVSAYGLCDRSCNQNMVKERDESGKGRGQNQCCSEPPSISPRSHGSQFTTRRTLHLGGALWRDDGAVISFCRHLASDGLTNSVVPSGHFAT